MENVKKLELMLAGWYKQLPFHLPAGGRKWLAENMWILVIIGVVASVFSLFGMVRTLMWAQELNKSVYDLGVYYGVTTQAYNPYTDVALWIGIVSFVAMLVLEIKAIQPLKARRKSGWNLLFMVLLVSLVSSVLTVLVRGDLFGLIGAAIGLAIGGFFLFEIRDGFQAAPKTKTSRAGAAAVK